MPTFFNEKYEFYFVILILLESGSTADGVTCLVGKVNAMHVESSEDKSSVETDVGKS